MMTPRAKTLRNSTVLRPRESRAARVASQVKMLACSARAVTVSIPTKNRKTSPLARSTRRAEATGTIPVTIISAAPIRAATPSFSPRGRVSTATRVATKIARARAVIAPPSGVVRRSLSWREAPPRGHHQGAEAPGPEQQPPPRGGGRRPRSGAPTGQPAHTRRRQRPPRGGPACRGPSRTRGRPLAASPGSSSLPCAALLGLIGDDLDLRGRDQTLLHHVVEQGEEGADLLVTVHDLHDHRQVVR